MNIGKALEKCGLTSKQAKVYITCLELGGGKVSDIAQKASIKRTSCYHILSDLTQYGLVTKTENKKVEFFISEDPQTLIQKEKEKLNTISILLPQLNAIYNRFPYKPKISFYEGWEGAKIIYEDELSLLNKSDMLLNYTGFADYFNYMPREYAENYIKRRIKKGIKIKIIAPYSEAAKEFEKRAHDELREIKLVSANQCNFSGDLHIYKNKVGIISFKDNFMSVLIESKEIADMQKMAFELMWKGADQ